MIETLLPKAGFDEALGRGRFLELWAKRQAPLREGWLAFHHIKTEVDTDAKQSNQEDLMDTANHETKVAFMADKTEKS
jgi:hypothetical protein